MLSPAVPSLEVKLLRQHFDETLLSLEAATPVMGLTHTERLRLRFPLA